MTIQHARSFGLCLLLSSIFLFSTSTAFAAGPPCNPCAGIVVADPQAAVAALKEGLAVTGESRLYVAWPALLDGTASRDGFAAVRAAGGTPWVTVEFTTPSPVLQHLDAFEAEIKALAELVRGGGERLHVQVGWRPSAGEVDAKDLGFVFKRAAVAINGAQPDARVLLGLIPTREDFVRALYGEEIAAYVDGIVLGPTPIDELKAAAALLAELDAGKPLSLAGLPWPAANAAALARAAENSAAGVAVSLFDFNGRVPTDLGPLKILARDFQGDLSLDPYSPPTGAKAGWVFVRGEDLGQRVIAEAPEGATQMALLFGDTQLSNARIVDLATGEENTPASRRTAKGYWVPVQTVNAAAVLKIDRAAASEIEGGGIEDKVEIADERQMPVEEILRRLQAFEDDQARKVQHYQATNTLHLRFRIGNGAESVDVAFEGPFFFRRKEGFDWVWQDLYVNGVRWRGKTLPEIPLVQPEKAAVLPLEINFTKEYSYRLRGQDVVDGRSCWVVDFEPIDAKPGSGLYQGTVWVDRELYARVRTRASQVGLQGEVISSEETMIFSPVDANGQPAPWAASSYILPLRNVGQQILSLLNSSTQVERETVLTHVRINAEDFDGQRETARASDATMVRDTAQGLRYLEKTESGERVVKEDIDKNRFFLLGGVFYDESLDFPLPLAGVNYLDLDFRGRGDQLNIFFAGVFLTANYADPRFLGSKWDAGVNVFGFFIPTGDDFFVDGREDPRQEIESSRGSVGFYLGRPLGKFTKLDFSYGAGFRGFQRADDTAEAFVLPEDTLTHSFETELTYSRSGWRLAAQGSIHRRADWGFWGLPGNTAFDPAQEEYTRWQASVAKKFWMPKFMQFGIELEYMGGQDLDRFSKYDFGPFGDADVAGYRGGLVLAEEAKGLHLSYGVNIGNLFQVEIDGDAVWASDEISGLDDELLAGVGLEGTVMGPWQTLVNFEIGKAVAGPDDGFSARVVFLKLFNDRKKKKG
jgi:hypothetical protein